MLALYTLYRQRYRLFLLTLAVGFLNKEVILFLLPLYPLNVESYRMFTVWNKSSLETMLYCLSKHKEVWDIFQVFHFLWLPFLLMLWLLYRERGWRDKLFLGSTYIVLPLLVGRLFATDANRVFVMMLPWVYGLAGLYFQRIRLLGNPALLLTLAFIYLALNYGWVESEEGQIMLDITAMVLLAVQRYLARPNAVSSDLSQNAG